MSTITDLSGALVASLSGGQSSARASFGSKTQAFAWTTPTLNAAISAVAGAVAESRTFPAVRIDNTTPVTAWTTGTKTPTATLEVVDVVLQTFPGVISVKTSDLLDGANLGQAIGAALYGQALVALDKHLIAQLVTDGTALDAAATLQTIAQAQAEVMSAGGSPNLIIVPPTLYASIVGGSGGILGSGWDPSNAALTLFGARLVVSTALAAAEAIVMDASSALSIELSASPVALVDTHAVLNTADVVVECVGGSMVTAPHTVIVVKAVI